MSRSTVSRICEQISTEFTAWSTRSLADIEPGYLDLDGTWFRSHPAESPAQAAEHHHPAGVVLDGVVEHAGVRRR